MDDSTSEALDRIRQEMVRRGLPPPAPPVRAEGPSVAPGSQGQHGWQTGRAGLSHKGARMRPSRLWLRCALVVIGLLVALPWLAPLFAAAGWWGLADPIYTLYMFLCHQLPERAATLFGYQVAFCWRNSAIYAGLFGFGMLYALSSRDRTERGDLDGRSAPTLHLRLLARLPRAISLSVYLLTLAPLALDGFTHMLGLRDGPFNDPTFGSFLVGSQFLSLNWWLRISTGLLAAFGTVWFTFPRLDIYMATTRVTRVRDIAAIAIGSHNGRNVIAD